MDNFQNNPETKLIIMNLQAGGVGITPTAASDVVFVELPWTQADCDQVENRVHRDGQKKAVNAYYLLDSKTIDGKIWDCWKRNAGCLNRRLMALISVLRIPAILFRILCLSTRYNKKRAKRLLFY